MEVVKENKACSSKGSVIWLGDVCVVFIVGSTLESSVGCQRRSSLLLTDGLIIPVTGGLRSCR